MEARANESQKLLNWGYQAFDAVRLFEQGKPLTTPAVWKGSANQASARRRRRSSSACPRARAASCRRKVERTDPLVAPLAKGQRVGTLKVTTAAGAPVLERAAGGARAGGQAGIFGRAWDALRLWIK